MPNLIRAEGNERLDLADYLFSTQTTLREILRHAGAEFFANPTGQRSWVLSGFDITNPAGKQLQVDKGRAFLAERDGAQVFYGQLSTEGDANKVVDLTGQPAGTYNIYVRFEYVDGAIGSRVFWNAAGSGSEFAQNINTRKLSNWSLRVELGAPGAEWLKIGEVDQATMAITDQRPFFFEGDPDASYATGWGAGNDRNADRATYGVQDLQTFTAAVRTAIEDVKGQGLRRWWDPGIGGLNIGFDGSPVEDRIALGDADSYIEYNPTSQVARWRWSTDAQTFYGRTTNEFGITSGVAANFDTRIQGAEGFDTEFRLISPSPAFDGGLRMFYDYSANELRIACIDRVTGLQSSAAKILGGEPTLYPGVATAKLGDPTDRWALLGTNVINFRIASYAPTDDGDFWLERGRFHYLNAFREERLSGFVANTEFGTVTFSTPTPVESTIFTLAANEFASVNTSSFELNVGLSIVDLGTPPATSITIAVKVQGVTVASVLNASPTTLDRYWLRMNASLSPTGLVSLVDFATVGFVPNIKIVPTAFNTANAAPIVLEFTTDGTNTQIDVDLIQIRLT